MLLISDWLTQIILISDWLTGLIDAHAQFKATLGEADKEFSAIIALIHECESFAKQYNVPGATINPYTNLTGKDVQSKWNEVKTLVPQRDQTLQDELRKQENNEALRRSFAEKANQVGPWIERQMDAVAAIGMVNILASDWLTQNILISDFSTGHAGIPGGAVVKTQRIRGGSLPGKYSTVIG